jgi:hypothetical protein
MGDSPNLHCCSYDCGYAYAALNTQAQSRDNRLARTPRRAVGVAVAVLLAGV